MLIPDPLIRWIWEDHQKSREFTCWTAADLSTAGRYWWSIFVYQRWSDYVTSLSSVCFTKCCEQSIRSKGSVHGHTHAHSGCVQVVIDYKWEADLQFFLTPFSSVIIHSSSSQTCCLSTPPLQVSASSLLPFSSSSKSEGVMLLILTSLLLYLLWSEGLHLLLSLLFLFFILFWYF